MAYAPTMAAALSGATINQLRHWRNAQTKSGPLLMPEVSISPRVFYSFRDLLALRTFVRLRQNASLQKIRMRSATSATWERLTILPATSWFPISAVPSSLSRVMTQRSTWYASRGRLSCSW